MTMPRNVRPLRESSHRTRRDRVPAANGSAGSPAGLFQSGGRRHASSPAPNRRLTDVVWGSAWMITAVGLILAGLPPALAAQENVNVDSTESAQKHPSESSPRYRVIDVPLIVEKDRIVPSNTLSEAAAGGYRIVNAAPFGSKLTVLLERSDKPLKTYEYVILDPKKPVELSMELV